MAAIEHQTIPREVLEALQLSLREVKITPITGKGVVNSVALIESEKGNFIVRSSSADNLPTYEKESWCMQAARKVGVPGPLCVTNIVVGNRAYNLQNALEAIDGLEWSGSRLELYQELGRLNQLINSIATINCGFDLMDSTTGSFNTSWSDEVGYCIDYLFENDLLADGKVLARDQIKKAKDRLELMLDWQVEPRLCHGDIGPKNAMVGKDNTVYIIDWGTACSSLAPHRDLVEVFAWKVNSEEQQSYLKGYGMTSDEFEDIRFDVETLMLRRYLESSHWAIKKYGGIDNISWAKQCVVGINRILG